MDSCRYNIILKNKIVNNEIVKNKIDKNKKAKNKILSASINVLKKMVVSGMTFMMLFSPNFLPRSAFSGSVFLIIAACMLLRIQDEYAIILISKRVKRAVCVVGMLFFVITTVATFYGSYYYGEQVRDIVAQVKASDYAKKTVINVSSIRPVHDVINTASYYHLNFYKMSDDEKDWRNVAFARYYGIKGIRMVKYEAENGTGQQ